MAARLRTKFVDDHGINCVIDGEAEKGCRQNIFRVVHIFKTIGGYNLIALVVAEDQNTLESISIEKCSLRSGAGIRRSEFYPIGEIHFSQFPPIREYLAHEGKETAPCNVDCKPRIRYANNKCVGCPTTIHCRGAL
ncbi:hypothetical protein KEJ32_03970 [Candidatus Bathyarchaeota archaeon]|nr:hypothetical protein [Candidatus Bathyarchaeota archaeon]